MGIGRIKISNKVVYGLNIMYTNNSNLILNTRNGT